MTAADRIQSCTDEQLVFLGFAFNMWINTEELCGKPGIGEVIETFYQCEARSRQVIWSHRSLRIAIAWLRKWKQIA